MSATHRGVAPACPPARLATVPEPVFLLRQRRPYSRGPLPDRGMRGAGEVARDDEARADLTCNTWPDGSFDFGASLPRAWPFATELDPNTAYEFDDEALDDEVAERVLARPATARTIAARIVGWAVLSLALLGCGYVLSHHEAGHEALGWVTLGHEHGVQAIARAGASTLRGLVDQR